MISDRVILLPVERDFHIQRLRAPTTAAWSIAHAAG
jgi:hypothetical protein